MIAKANVHRGSKTEFERTLNDGPLPESLKNNHPPIRFYGRWLRSGKPAEFERLYKQWLKAQ